MLRALVATTVAVALFYAVPGYAGPDDCSCKYELDKNGGEFYFVLRKDADEEKPCKILVLSRSNESSPYYQKLKREVGYNQIGKFRSFEGARFMALGECPDCK
ncbi:hypothetical protein GC174_07320 [bacterium]|nr:hypothetical protein [bacterium]